MKAGSCRRGAGSGPLPGGLPAALPAGGPAPPVRSFALLHALAVLLAAQPATLSGQVPALSLHGTATGAEFGRVLLALPDVNQDGVSDLAAGSPHGDGVAGPYAGVVHVLCGRTGAVLHRWEGDQRNARFGSSLASASLSGSGTVELLIGAPQADGPAGPASGSVSIYTLGPGIPYGVVYGTAPLEAFGSSLAALDDSTGDGRPEFAVGAPRASPSGIVSAGRVAVIDGASLAPLASLPGVQKFGFFGSAIASAGDVTGNGREEVAVGIPRFHAPGALDAGRVEIYSATGFLVASRSGSVPGGRFGSALAGPGDLNGDGIPDLVASSPHAAGPAGNRAGHVEAFALPAFGSIWSASGDQAGGLFGSSLAVTGDQGTDQIPEVLAGSPLKSAAHARHSGSADLLSGATGDRIWSVAGSRAGSRLGTGLAGGRDFNSDGRDDCIVGVPLTSSPSGHINAGAILGFGAPASEGFITEIHNVGASPEQLLLADFDGDNDVDVAVLLTGLNQVCILWNGSHGGPGSFTTLPPSFVQIPSGGTATRFAAADIAGTGVPAIAAGDSNSTVHLLYGQSVLGVPVWSSAASWTPTQPGGEGPVRGLAFQNTGAVPCMVVATEGASPGTGSVHRIDDPLGAPSDSILPAPSLSYGDLRIEDLDGDGWPEIALAGVDGGGAGFLQILYGPSYSAFFSSPVQVSPARIAALDLGSPFQGLDLLPCGAGSGQAPHQAFVNWAGSSFGGTASIGQIVTSKSAASIRLSGQGPGAAIVAGDGSLLLLLDWAEGGFSNMADPGAAGPFHDVAAGVLRSLGAAGAGHGYPSVVVSKPAAGQVHLLHQAVPHRIQDVPAVDCNGTGLHLGFSGRPVLGNATFAIHASGGLPFTTGFLAVFTPPPGAASTTIPAGTCHALLYGPAFILIPATLDHQGAATFYVPVPSSTGLLFQDYSLQWIFPAAGGAFFDLSPASIVRFGEY